MAAAFARRRRFAQMVAAGARRFHEANNVQGPPQGRRTEPAHAARRRTDPPRRGANFGARRDQWRRPVGPRRDRALGQDEPGP